MSTVAEIETRKSRKEAKLRLTKNKLEWTLTGENWDMFAFVRNKTYSYSLENVEISVFPGYRTMFGSEDALLKIIILKPKNDTIVVKVPYEQKQELLNFSSQYIYAKKKRKEKIKYQKDVDRAKLREKARDYEAAIEIWEDLGDIKEAARVRKIQEEMGSVKVTQSVVHGDQITEVKDSVINKSKIGTGGDDKFAKLEKLTVMKEKGLIDDDEFKQMKKEILGK